MIVTVTGATGFIGGHVVRALDDAGHTARALVRSNEKLDTVRSLHGLGPIDHVVGDITSATCVDEALAGADAIIHLAAVTDMAGVEFDAISRSNVGGGSLVLDRATQHGCDPIIHLSSVAAIFPPTGPVLHESDRVSQPEGGYSRTKAELDRHARELQEDGAPVVIVYPGGVVGPTDAGVNVVADGMTRIINSGSLVFPASGGNIWIDVRDLAAVLVQMLERGRGPRRYMAGGNFVTWDDLISLLDRLTGGEYAVNRPQAQALKAMALEASERAATTGEAPSIDVEAVTYMCDAVPSDDSTLLDEFGIRWRPPEDTWRDMLAWAADRGLLDDERASPYRD